MRTTIDAAPARASTAGSGAGAREGVAAAGRTGTAVVVHDAARTDVAAPTQATAAAGFPAAPLE